MDPVYEYLFELQESGTTNMVQAVPFIQSVFPGISKDEAQQKLIYWLANYATLKKDYGRE